MLQDLRSAFRFLRTNPGLSVVVIGCLGFGLGATLALFTLADQLLFRPFPGLSEPERLVAVYTARPQEPDQWRFVSYEDYADLAQAPGTLTGLAAFAEQPVSLVDSRGGERIWAGVVSLNYFEVLGVEGTIGRLFLPGEDRGQPRVVLSYAFWQSRFGSQPEAVGRSVTLNGQPCTVIGVAPLGFVGTRWVRQPDLWVPLDTFATELASGLSASSGLLNRRREWLSLVGRLEHGAGVEQADAEVKAHMEQLAALHPDTNSERGGRAVPLRLGVFGAGQRQQVERYIHLLVGMALLLLLIGCINASGLLLARGMKRRRELAIRRSLGAGRAHLVRLLLVEGLVLGFLGGGVGLVVARGLLPWLSRLQLPVEASYELAFDGRQLLYTVGLSLLVGLFVGALPALRLSAVAPAEQLREAEPQVSGGLRLAVRELLWVGQVAAATVFLIGAGLMLRTLVNLRAIPLGFEPENTLAVSVDLAQAGYSPERMSDFYRELLSRLRALPAVRFASLAGALPMVGSELSMQLTVTAGDQPGGEGGAVAANHAVVGTDFFKTLGIPLLRGREFLTEDAASPQGRVILSEALATALWPGEDPLGRPVLVVRGRGPFEVIGVAGDGKYASLREEPFPTLSLFEGQVEQSWLTALVLPQMTLLVRGEGAVSHLTPIVQREARALDANLPLFGITTLEDRLSGTVRLERQSAALLTGAGGGASFLALAGIYALIAYIVGGRRKEIGIRMALGARRRTVLGRFLRRGFLLASLGIVLGLGGAMLASPYLAGQLYAVDPRDPLTLAAVVVGLLLTTLLASGYAVQRGATDSLAAVLREE